MEIWNNLIYHHFVINAYNELLSCICSIVIKVFFNFSPILFPSLNINLFHFHSAEILIQEHYIYSH